MAKDIALDLDEEAEAADDQLVGAGSKNRETTAVDEPDYINKDDGENLAEITGAGDGETAACPLPVAGPRSEPPQAYGDHPSGNEQHPTSRSEVKRRRSADEAETPSSIAARTRSQLRRAPYPATNTPGDQERRASDVGRTPEQGAANCDGSQGDAIDDGKQLHAPEHGTTAPEHTMATLNMMTMTPSRTMVSQGGDSYEKRTSTVIGKIKDSSAVAGLVTA
ncbi:hypothetical protein PInf_021460 [Phytophthora infestans]|nr:hypothetical protein PInf_021460 [Phytophthora infestans]